MFTFTFLGEQNLKVPVKLSSVLEICVATCFTPMNMIVGSDRRQAAKDYYLHILELANRDKTLCANV